MKLLRDIPVKTKSVFVRCEFNVAMDEDETVMDFTRLKASLPTLNYLRNENARVVICSHMGRPWGKRDPSKSLRQLVDPLSNLLNCKIQFVDDCIGPGREAVQSGLKPGEILLLENVRYYSEENENNIDFARQLISGIDLYVNDAFGNCHRPHASMVAAARVAPDRCAGFLLTKELHELELIHDANWRPSVAIIGGAKVSGKDGKIAVILNLIEKMDTIVVVGKIAYFFLLANNIEVGSTLTADKRGIDAPGADLTADVAACREVIEKAGRLGRQLILPVDSITDGPGGDQLWEHDKGSLQQGRRALDIGPATIKKITQVIADSKLVVWNGPAGFFEKPEYKKGTLSIVQALESSNTHAVIGGGDTVAAVAEVLAEQLPARIHVCTGGGAMLTWLMGKPLPAVAALE